MPRLHSTLVRQCPSQRFIRERDRERRFFGTVFNWGLASNGAAAAGQQAGRVCKCDPCPSTSSELKSNRQPGTMSEVSGFLWRSPASQSFFCWASRFRPGIVTLYCMPWRVPPSVWKRFWLVVRSVDGGNRKGSACCGGGIDIPLLVTVCTDHKPPWRGIL